MACQLHIVIVPLMSPGHFIPMMDMAKLLAQHQVTVTIIATPLVASRIEATIDCATKSGLSLRLIQLPFPSVEAGLPEGCETADTIPSQNLIKNFFAAIDLLQQPFERLFELLVPSPTCIIADKNIIFLSETARKYRIPRIIFDGMSCFTLLCSHSLHISKVHESTKEAEPFVVPGLPDRIELTKEQLPGEFNPGTTDVLEFRKRVREAEEKADGVVINSFEELEKQYVNEYRKVRGGNVWCIGPLSLCNESDFDKAQRGNKSSIDSSKCLKWLNSQEPSSVVYACLGSLNRLTKPQLVELGLGLEASKCPFIWVIRGGDRAKEMEEWLEEEGFEERTRERGLVIRGWAPQVLILSHKAVGAFLTHCGWNSTLEGVCVGVPMVTWPMFAEQFFNEKLVVQVLEVGVSIGAQVVVHFGEEDKFGVLVKREMVTGAVDRVMDEGKEGRERRKKARALWEMATRAVKQGGSTQVNMTLLIEGIMQQASQMQLE